jgi:hypothetical protein
MLVLLYFHRLGFSPIEIASLFILYEISGVFTSLLGGWLASRVGLAPYPSTRSCTPNIGDHNVACRQPIFDRGVRHDCASCVRYW